MTAMKRSWYVTRPFFTSSSDGVSNHTLASPRLAAVSLSEQILYFSNILSVWLVLYKGTV